MRKLLTAGLAALALAGCPSKKPNPNPDPVATTKDAASPTPVAVTDDALGDPVHGKELVLQYQCNRCHDGTGHPAAVDQKHCVHCHENIMTDRFKAARATIAKWKPRVKELADAPSLEATAKRFNRRWVESYLLEPNDLRPHLNQYMPRLALSPKDARDIAAHFVPDAEPKAGPLAADLGKGRQLLETKGCGSCHVMTGVVALPSSSPPAMPPRDFEKGHRLAPDLRFSRDRMSAPKMQAWLADPKAVKPDTLMPKIPLTPEEIKDITGYLLQVEIKAPAKPAKIARLPVLTRAVTFQEVDEKVFHRTCWHCHSEPDFAIGDGGPGNSGGFGFKPRGLNLSDYAGMIAGDIDDTGARQSIFAPDDKGVPRLVLALVARHDEEEQGGETGKVRGMPLGYDPLPLDQIQLVETWIAQGRKR